MLTSLATVVTLGVFLLQGNLSLHHASTASALLTVTLLPTHILESWRVRSPEMFVAQKVRFWTNTVIYLWITLQMPCVGTNHDCNLCTRTYTVGFAGHIAAPFNRSTRLATSIITSFLSLRSDLWFYGIVNTLQSVPAMFSRVRRRRWIAYGDQTLETLTSWRMQDIRLGKERVRARNPNGKLWSATYIWLWYDDHTTVAMKRAEWRRVQVSLGRETWLSRVLADIKVAIRVPRCQRATISLALAAILIYDIEKQVNMNLTASRDDWGYGQTFALVATIPSVAAAITMLLRLGKKPA